MFEWLDSYLFVQKSLQKSCSRCQDRKDGKLEAIYWSPEQQ